MNPFQGWLSLISSTAQPVLNFVKATWLRTLVYACVAALVVWFYGAYVRLGTWTPLAADQDRLLAVGAVFVAWVLYLLWWAAIGRRRNKQLISALTDSGVDPGAATAMEVEQVRQRLQQALVQLRRLMGGRRGYLYELPWYVMIGPPGSGKTTALMNSSLKFPLAATMGREPLRGVGGTRNCEWWITEQAILLDTAGRYTTQDSDPDADRGAWQGFLKLLKQYRPLQPINGVIVTLSIEDIASAPAAERLAHAQAIRSRIYELNQTFSSRFPVYVMFTKADLIAGFVEFFDALNRTDREQVWGMTFPLDDGRVDTPPAAQRFDPEFDLLMSRLNVLMLERLQQEVDIDRRGAVYGFPSQMVTLKEPVAEFLAEVFTTSRFDQRPLLRGVYFASGTQSGVPVDRMMQSMATAFGMEAPRAASFTGAVKSYFLKHLLDSVVFAEASLASVNTRMLRRRRIVRRALLLASVAVLAGMGGLWGYAYWLNQEMVARLDTQVAKYEEAAKAVPGNPVGDTDFAAVVPPLDTLEEGFGLLRRQQLRPWRVLGLNQDAKLAGQYTDTYVRALGHMLLPRVLVDLQNRMRERRDDPEFQFEALKIYLSLGNQGPVDVPFTRKWMQSEWETLYPSPEQGVLRADLNRHFAALLGHPLPTIPLDATLIDGARKQVVQRPLAQRTYALIRDSAEAQKVPAWRLLDKIGALGQRVFYRQSGKPLTEGIPGFYTRRGYFDVLLPQMGRATDQARKESWVYGASAPVGDSTDKLAPQIVALYRNDFDTQWRTMLADVRVAPFRSLDQGVQSLNALSGPDSILKKLVTSVTDDTDLTAPPADSKDPHDQEVALLAKAYGAGQTDTFQAMRDNVRSQNGQLADTVRTLDTLYNQLSRAGDPSNLTSNTLQREGGVTEAVQGLVSGSRRLAQPVDAWMQSLAANVTAISSGTTKTQLSALWQQSGQKFCQQAVTDRYPFSRGSRAEISLDDFDKLFAPGGVLDKFFDLNLKAYVNTAVSPWQWQYQGSKPINSLSLAQFERAATIRQAFYNANSTKLGIEFEVTPVSLDNVATNVVLELAGQAIPYNHGPVRSTTVRWPASSAQNSRIAFQPNVPNGALSVTGPWSAFRLLDTAELRPTGRDSSTAAFSVGEHTAEFSIRSSSVLNPFRLPELREFRCPDAL